MLYKRSFLFFSLLFVVAQFNFVYAQNNGGIRGFVRDSLTGEALSFANVVFEGTNIGVSTDVRGYYILASVPAGRVYTLRATFMGYKISRIPVRIEKDKIIQVDVKLSPGLYELDEVTALGDKMKKSNTTDLGLQKLSVRELEYIPKGVETDILRSLQFIPGVKTTSDVTAKYFVRGGSGDQNLVMLDGVTLYNPYHAFGIFSIIDPDMLNNIQFYKGGFTSEFGGRLSSVLNMSTKDGNKNQFSSSASSSFLTGKASLEGPIPDGSFIVTGRKSYLNSISKKFLDSKDIPFDFYDFSAKVNYMNPEIFKNSKFTANVFLSSDKVENHNPLKEDYKFINNLFSFQWFQVWEKPFYSQMNFSLSQFDAEVIPNLSSAKPRKNKISDFSMAWDFSYLFEGNDEIDVGLQFKSFSSLYNYQNLRGISNSIDDFGGQFTLYGKYKFLRYENLGIDIGSRLNAACISATRASIFEPRMSLTYKFNPLISFKAAWGIYTQQIMTLVDENEVISLFEPWIIIPEYLSPSESIHYVAGFDINPFEFFNVQIEGYYKVLKNLPAFNEKKISAADKDLISTNGESYGVEAYLKYQSPGIYSSLAYSLSWSYKYDDSVKYFPRYDSRHSLNYLISVSLGAGWQASAIFNIATGLPFTQIMGFIDKVYLNDLWASDPIFDSEKPYPLMAGKNLGRLPVYHRLDLSIAKKIKVFMFNVSLEANVINVYNRKNVFYIKRDTGERINMLPLFPTATIKIEI